jgi:hypothetical protein
MGYDIREVWLAPVLLEPRRRPIHVLLRAFPVSLIFFENNLADGRYTCIPGLSLLFTWPLKIPLYTDIIQPSRPDYIFSCSYRTTCKPILLFIYFSHFLSDSERNQLTYSFDTAMSQKSRFKQQEQGNLVIRKSFPQLPYGTIHNPKFVVTPTGSKLLVSGWWAYCRKPVSWDPLLFSLSLKGRKGKGLTFISRVLPVTLELRCRLYPKLDLGTHHRFWEPNPLLPASFLLRNGKRPKHHCLETIS